MYIMWSHIKLIQKLKSMLPLFLKLMLIRMLVLTQKIYYFFKSEKLNGVSTDKKVIYLLLSTDYSNLGDHALTYSHKKLLIQNFPDCQIVEIVVGETLKYFKFIKNNIKEGDVITLKGGGNIGLEYFREELYRRHIIKKIKDNKIIIFPQTVYFPESKVGKKEFEKTKRIFIENEHLFLITRDYPSYKKFEAELKNRVVLTPDIVLSLEDIHQTVQRKGAMTCMREDVEGIYSKSERKKMINILQKNYKTITISDTTTPYSISIEQREFELQKIWNSFAQAELVVTDRLHGMIFAAITGTPCIVLNTYNHKLRGQYEWLEHLEYIRFYDGSLDGIEKEIEKFKENQYQINPRNRYEEYYKIIIDLI